MFISFGHITKKHLLFLAVPIAIYMRRFFKHEIKLKEANNMFYIVFIQFLGRIINGILWIIVKKLSVSNEKEKQDNKDAKPVIFDQNDLPQNNHNILNEIESKKPSAYSQCKKDYNKKLKKNYYLVVFFLILVCFLDFYAVTCNTIIKQLNLIKEQSTCIISLTIVIRIFAIGLLSYFIIKNIKMYSHHILSGVIILLVVIITHIISIFTEGYENYWSKLGLSILPELSFSIMYVCGAKYLSITQGNIYKFLFIDGIIGIFLSILIQIISYYSIKCDDSQNVLFSDNYGPYCYKNNLKTMMENFKFRKFDVPFSIAVILSTFIETWLIWFLIFNFSVNHFSAIHPIPLLFYFIISKIYDNNNKNNNNTNIDFKKIDNIMFIFGGVIIILMTFIFNEIIILKFCNFDKNTNVEINKRAVKEFICDFGDDKSEIYATSSENYLIYKEDIEDISDDKEKQNELSTY